MPYIRISLMRPMSGQAAEVQRLNRELLDFYKRCPGCLAAYLLEATDGSNEMGRLTIWESEEDADRAANAEHSLALRSQLHLRVQPGHVDRSFQATAAL